VTSRTCSGLSCWVQAPTVKKLGTPIACVSSVSLEALGMSWEERSSRYTYLDLLFCDVGGEVADDDLARTSTRRGTSRSSSLTTSLNQLDNLLHTASRSGCGSGALGVSTALALVAILAILENVVQGLGELAVSRHVNGDLVVGCGGCVGRI